jgi:hypothetical protein
MDTRDLDKALAKLQSLAAVGSPHNSRVNAEQRYGLAYQMLVRAGLRPQIRGKHRTGKLYQSQGGGHNNGGTSFGKHMPHPAVPGFRKHGYKCEASWNRPEKKAS